MQNGRLVLPIPPSEIEWGKNRLAFRSRNLDLPVGTCTCSCRRWKYYCWVWAKKTINWKDATKLGWYMQRRSQRREIWQNSTTYEEQWEETETGRIIQSHPPSRIPQYLKDSSFKLKPSFRSRYRDEKRKHIIIYACMYVIAIDYQYCY